jgi:hypothetical protein
MVKARRARAFGKKIVYITPYRNLAVEMKQMYERKGEMAEVETETDKGGQTMYLVYVFEKGY